MGTRRLLALSVVAGLAGWLILPALPAQAARKLPQPYLDLQDCPDHPGCPAIILLDETEINFDFARPRYSRRQIIKFFTPEGVQEYSDIALRRLIRGWDLEHLSGRTVLPDGREIRLKERNVTTRILREGRRKRRVKSVHLPGIEPGAIAEISYDIKMDYGIKRSDVWIIQRTIPVLQTRYIVKSWFHEYNWIQSGLTDIEVTPRRLNETTRMLSAKRVPPIPFEPFGPSPVAVLARVYLYPPGAEEDWLEDLALQLSFYSGAFIEGTEEIRKKVDSLISRTDPERVRAKYLYDFLQREIRTEEEALSERGEDREPDAPENAGEVLSRGYGNEMERTLLYIALAREAGLETGFLLLSSRYNGPFNENVPDYRFFDSFAAAVKFDDGWKTVDPATPFCAFGMIGPEKESNARNGIMVFPDKDAISEVEEDGRKFVVRKRSGYSIIAIPFAPANQSVLTRNAIVTLREDGSAEVEVTEQGTGHADLTHHQLFANLEEPDRRLLLQENLGVNVPDAELQDASFENFNTFNRRATIHGKWIFPDIASPAGDRLVLTPSIFHAKSTNPFTSDSRKTPVYFPYAGCTRETIRIELPAGYRIRKLPEAVDIQDPPFSLSINYRESEGSLRVERRLEIDTAHWPTDRYDRLKKFFEKMRKADMAAVVLEKIAQE